MRLKPHIKCGAYDMNARIPLLLVIGLMPLIVSVYGADGNVVVMGEKETELAVRENISKTTATTITLLPREENDTDFVGRALALSNIDPTLLISIFALALSVINMYLINRGPKIKCSKITYLMIGDGKLDSSGNIFCGTFINPHLTFSNVGSRTGIIETLKIELELEDGSKLGYAPAIEPMKIEYLADGLNHPAPKAYEAPVTSFSLKAGESIFKNILFKNEIRSNVLKKGKYILRVYYRMAGESGFLQCSERKIWITEDLYKLFGDRPFHVTNQPLLEPDEYFKIPGPGSQGYMEDPI